MCRTSAGLAEGTAAVVLAWAMDEAKQKNDVVCSTGMSGQSVWSVSWWHFGQWLVMVILSNFIALSVCVVLWSVVWHFGQWLVMVSLTCQPTV